jgi:hypothetical protein
LGAGPVGCGDARREVGAADVRWVGVTVCLVDAVFRLHKVVAGLSHFAEVKVDVVPAARDEVAVSAGAFDWRRETYGPGAVVSQPGDRLLMAEAVEGVRYVLGRLPSGVRYRVGVTTIMESPVDTSMGDVKLAAALAMCAALTLQLDPPPRLEAAGAVFPD